MSGKNIILNHVFYQNANKYYARPVLAAQYQPGMENGWIVRYSSRATDNKKAMLYEGARFFPTIHEAWDFVNADGQQSVNRNGVLIRMEVNYENPLPVLYKEETNAEDNEGRMIQPDRDAFLSDESDKYEYFILGEDCWIVQELDGVIRVWDRSMEEPFFGDGLKSVYEINVDGEYIRVAV